MIIEDMLPYRKLYVAVLENALRDLKRPVGMHKPANIKRCKRSAKAWFNSKQTGFNAFVGICKFLNLDPDKIRDRISAGKVDFKLLLSKRGNDIS